MKSVFYLITLLVLCSCSTIVKYATMEPKPSENIRNPKCEDIVALKVFQTLDNFVLTNICDSSDDRFCFGLVVYVAKDKDKIYYDDQMIVPSDTQCFSYSGTYKYTTTAKSTKVVPKAKLISATIPNPEFEIWKKNYNQ